MTGGLEVGREVPTSCWGEIIGLKKGTNAGSPAWLLSMIVMELIVMKSL